MVAGDISSKAFSGYFSNSSSSGLAEILFTNVKIILASRIFKFKFIIKSSIVGVSLTSLIYLIKV